MRWLLDHSYAYGLQATVAWILSIGCLGAALLWRHPRLHADPAKRLMLAALVACSLLASWANFFQARNNGTWIHRWDLFHTFVGAKYFPELGYDHLYDCAYVLVSQRDPKPFKSVERVRDLGTLETVRTKRLLERNDCAERFSSERATTFVDDVLAFHDLGLRPWQKVFKDKGYNGTPFYTLIAHEVAERVPIRYGTLLAVALVDIALLVLMVVVVARTRGLVIACLVLATLATLYPGRFVHMGASFLRFDYLVALVIGLCALATKRPAIAGFLLAYATLIRVFPAFYVLGVLIAYAAAALRDRKLSDEAVRFCAGGLAGVILLGGATFVFGNGLHDWQVWWHELQQHTKYSAAFRVGFKHMFMLDGSLIGEENAVPYPEKAELFEPRRIYYLACVVLLIAPFLTRARRWDAASFAAVFGTVLFFLALIATRYYYAVLLLPLLADPKAIGERAYAVIAGLLSLATASAYAVASAIDDAGFINNIFVGAQLTLLALALAVWSARQYFAERASTTAAPR